jgi:hypothetical protein
VNKGAGVGATELPRSVSIDEIPEADAGAIALFRHRFKDAPPAEPHHVVARFRDSSGAVRTACYVHFTPFGDMLLGGGACIDPRVVRAMSATEREALKIAGGLYHATLAWAVAHFAPRYPAIFGYCGDALAERVDLAVGFARTAHPHLLVLWTRELDGARRADLIARAHAVGPF